MKTRIVGLDYGSARIGVALSDEMKILASPLFVFHAKKENKSILEKLIAHSEEYSYSIEKIVVGLPLQLNGQHGSQADEVMTFIEALRSKTDVPIETWDERFSTAQAERSMKEASMSRKNRAKIVDKVAAVIILQSYLDRLV